MIGDVSIGELAGRYRIPSGTLAPEEWQLRFDDLMAGPVARCFENEYVHVLRRLGVESDAVAAVRALNVKIRVRGLTVEDSTLAKRWAEGLADRLHEVLEPLAPLGGVSEHAALFMSLADAERRFLLASIAGTPDGWWWGALLGDGPGEAPAPAAILEARAWREPQTLPALIVELAQRNPGLAAILDDRAAGRIVAQILAAFAAGTPRSRGATAEALGAAAASTPNASIGAAAASVIGVHTVERLATILVEQPASALDLDPTVGELEAWLGRWSGDSIRPGRIVRPRDEPVDDEVDSDAGGTDHALDSHVSSGERPATGTFDGDVHDGDPFERLDPLSVVEQSSLVGCTGLLFLLRPLERTAWFDELAPGEVAGQLLCLGAHILMETLRPLGPGELRAALVREGPTLAAFVGCDALPEDWQSAFADVPTDVLALAVQLEIVLATALGEGDALDERALRLNFGKRTQRALDAHLASPLVRLVSRVGRIQRVDCTTHVHMPLDAVDPALRRAGLDTDPGWLPWHGNTTRFHYDVEGWS